MTVRIQHINESDPSYFIDLLGGVFEHSPWVADQAFLLSPFTSRENLHESMVNIVRKAPPERQLELLCRHPELAGKEAASGHLTRASRNEQAGAGLDQCSADELAQLDRCNRDYRSRFGFPFIIAVTGLDKAAILAAMQRRLQNSREDEFRTALAEVEKIAWIRICALING